MNPEQLLIIEDDEVLRGQLARALQRHAGNIHECASVPACHEMLAQLPPLDAALLDLNLGDDNGLELIPVLLEHSPQCRVLVLTGYGSIPTAVSATRLGAWNYLTKPAGAREILAALSAEDNTIAELPERPPSLHRLEWEYIQRVLAEHDGNVSAAARTLGIHRRTLQRRLQKRPSPTDYERDRKPEKPGGTGQENG